MHDRFARHLILLLGVPTLFVLIRLFYINYSRPSMQRYSAMMSSHLAFRPLPQEEVMNHTNCVHGHCSNVTVINVIRSKKFDINSVSLMLVPFNVSYGKNFAHVVPRAAFFDKRRRGGYKNSTVVLTHINRTETIKVVGCIIDGYYTDNVELNPININNWIHKNHPECTHDNVLYYCFNTPGRNNSKVALVYENPQNQSEIFITDSEHPLFVPKSRETSKEFASSVMACTAVFGTPPYFGAWLRYQKSIGVDFVYVNAAETFLCGDAYKDTFLQESLRNGFVQLKVWKEYLTPPALFYHSQALHYQNCVYRFQGIYNYAIMGDFDDFVIPARGKSIRQALQSLFDPNPHLGGIQLSWFLFYEPEGGLDYDVIMAGNFSRYVDGAKPATNERNSKSIHKLTATSDVGIHKVSRLMAGYTRRDAPKNVVYMAHFKHKDKLRHYATEQC